MKKKSKISIVFLVFSLSAILATSGCIDSQGIFLSGIEAYGDQKTVSAPKEVVVIEGMKVIPTPPVNANSTFTLSFEVVNMGNADDGAKEVEEVNVYAYDWGRCRVDGGSSVLDLNGNLPGLTGMIIPPGGGSERVNMGFVAPDNTMLGNVEGRCDIRLGVDFQYDAYTVSDISIVSTERLKEASTQGETINVNPIQTQSRGPLKIDLIFETSQPVEKGILIPAILAVRDIGGGQYSKVPAGSLEIQTPSGIKISSCHPDNVMGTPVAVPGGGWSVRNSDDEIVLVNGESSPIRCDLESEETIKGVKTYNVKAEILDYKYTLYEEIGVEIKPAYKGD